MGSRHDVSTIFDEPSMWRADAAQSLGLRGLDLAAGVTPGASFPAVLRTITDHLHLGSDDMIVDIGAGLGGASMWLQQRTGARVIAVEPSTGSRRAAAALFPALDMRAGDAGRTGLRSGIANLVTVLGVCSLLDDLDKLFTEAHRLLRDGGTLGIADLFLTVGDVASCPPNTFRSFEVVCAELRHHGFEPCAVGMGVARPRDDWQRVADLVDRRVEAEHEGAAEFADWDVDRRHLRAQIDDGRVIGGCVVARMVHQ